MTYSASSNYDLNSPTSVFGRGESQTEWEATASGSQTQWWNATMPSEYAGFHGATINGNTLVTHCCEQSAGHCSTNVEAKSPTRLDEVRPGSVSAALVLPAKLCADEIGRPCCQVVRTRSL